MKFPVSYAGKRGLCIVCQERLQVSDDLKKLTWLKIEEFPADDSDAVGAAQVLDSSVSESEFNLVLGERLFGWQLSRQQTLWLTLGLVVLLVVLGIYFSIESQKVPPKTQKGAMEIGHVSEPAIGKRQHLPDFHAVLTQTKNRLRHFSLGQPGFNEMFNHKLEETCS